MSYIVGTPPQVAAGATLSSSSRTSTTGSKHSVTETFAIPKLTPTGTAGSVTFKDGAVTAYTPPT